LIRQLSCPNIPEIKIAPVGRVRLPLHQLARVAPRRKSTTSLPVSLGWPLKCSRRKIPVRHVEQILFQLVEVDIALQSLACACRTRVCSCPAPGKCFYVIRFGRLGTPITQLLKSISGMPSTLGAPIAHARRVRGSSRRESQAGQRRSLSSQRLVELASRRK